MSNKNIIVGEEKHYKKLNDKIQQQLREIRIENDNLRSLNDNLFIENKNLKDNNKILLEENEKMKDLLNLDKNDLSLLIKYYKKIDNEKDIINFLRKPTVLARYL